MIACPATFSLAPRLSQIAMPSLAHVFARLRKTHHGNPGLYHFGFEAVLTRKRSPASARQRIFDGAAEAKLIALACSKRPKGRVPWTLQLLETQAVELKIVDRASDNTMARAQEKNQLQPHLKKHG